MTRKEKLKLALKFTENQENSYDSQPVEVELSEKERVIIERTYSLK